VRGRKEDKARNILGQGIGETPLMSHPGPPCREKKLRFRGEKGGGGRCQGKRWQFEKIPKLFAGARGKRAGQRRLKRDKTKQEFSRGTWGRKGKKKKKKASFA